MDPSTRTPGGAPISFPLKRSSDPMPSPQLDKRPKPDPAEENVPKFAVTFGLELEFVFAFHEDELKSILTENKIEAKIVKEYSDPDVDVLFLNASEVRAARGLTRYPSWSLEVPDHDPVLCAAVAAKQLYSIRTYFVEPHLIAKKILAGEGLPADIVGSPNLATRESILGYLEKYPDGQLFCNLDIDYSKWTLTNDASLMGATKKRLMQSLPDRITSENCENWDSFGTEMVSPVFQYAEKDAAFRTIGKYLDALKRGSKPSPSTNETNSLTWGAIDSVWAGTHVHIGFKTNERNEVDMRLLQHIGYILISHEDLITQLHPITRSGKETPWTSPQLSGQRKPRRNWDDEEAVLEASELSYTGYWNVNPNSAGLGLFARKGRILKWSDMRDAIFDEGVDLEGFVKIMHGQDPDNTIDKLQRYFAVSWENLYKYRDNPNENRAKPTIEFRQHACALDADDLKHWVDLLFAIVMTAEKRYAQDLTFAGRTFPQNATFAEKQGSKYLKNDNWNINTVNDLMGPALLNLAQGEIDYWQARFDKYSRKDYRLRIINETANAAPPQTWLAAEIGGDDDDQLRTYADYEGIRTPGAPTWEVTEKNRREERERKRVEANRKEYESAQRLDEERQRLEREEEEEEEEEKGGADDQEPAGASIE